MIFLVPEKQFVKHAKKWLKVRDYIIIDGSDSGTIDMDDDGASTDISRTFNGVIVNGAFTPHNRLLEGLKRDLKSGDSDKLSWKTENNLQDYLDSKEFVGAVCAVVKGFIMKMKSNEDQRNVFIVIPNKVYRLLADRMLERIYKLFDCDFQFIYSLTELEDKKKLLTKDLKPKKMDKLGKRMEKLVKKYKLDK